ncbi:MAG: magnesium/cobalt efflux protein [Candidatus Methylumidiphilus alinenensis]|uniref:Magnesium/cobalt efflux protein n=1 Tax=Candidatus Methylumidiphilus alinenensis TaxID=2202197 RepID=A0A2W4QXC6_9GAMM|nr:MAG: magnesium/cobalt efflux protein [Candidatus Methylumidiphilus alinenensis]
MNEIPLSLLFVSLVLLLIISAFFSGAETALMALNRYRLLHRVKAGHPGAIRAQKLLRRPDRLIGLILLGNCFANILASSLTTVISLRLFGERGIAITAGVLTLAVLIFSEVAPKTLAARHPERLAFGSSWIIVPLMWLFYPVVWLVNMVANLLLRLLGFNPKGETHSALSKEELRTVVAEAGAMIPERYQNMLLSVLDLESASVEDIMIPRNEIKAIDLDAALDEIVEQIKNSRHTRLPVYRKSIDKVFGLLHLRKILIRMTHSDFNKETIAKSLDKIHFIPENMPLHQLLLNFRRENSRFGLVIDEYGDVMGLVSLEDLLQEIVGEFTPDSFDIQKQKDGSYLVDASITLRELNRVTGWALPTEGPKTLNGLIIEYLENIPQPGTSLRLMDHHLEITKMEGNLIKQVLVNPRQCG